MLLQQQPTVKVSTIYSLSYECSFYQISFQSMTILQNPFISSLLCVCFTLVLVNAHGNIVIPNNWFDHKRWISTNVFDYIGMKSGQQCSAGSELTNHDICPGHVEDCDAHPGNICMWFTNFTFIDKPTINDINLRTFLYRDHPEYDLMHPWLSPGSAHIESPCGLAGGNIYGCINGCHKPGGFPRGPKAEVFLQSKHNMKVTDWRRGSVVEVAWGITANHGGGYSYRMCKVPLEGIIGITEDCFQKTPLKFKGDKQWIQFGEDVATRFQISATRTSTGTTPPGSQWTKNPIPACRGSDGGYTNPTGDCFQGTQFTPPKLGLSGYGANMFRNDTNFQFSIIDKLIIPKDLHKGEYVLSFRWDCEQTPQVWNSCASIRIR